MQPCDKKEDIKIIREKAENIERKQDTFQETFNEFLVKQTVINTKLSVKQDYHAAYLKGITILTTGIIAKIIWEVIQKSQT